MTMNRTGILRFLVLITVIVGLALPAQAGWVEVEKDGSRSFISEGRWKEVPGDKSEEWTIADINKGIMTFVDPKRKTYTQATPDEMCKANKKIAEDMRKGLSPQERAMMKQMMGMQPKKPPKVLVKKAGKGGVIAGFKTTKYIVTADGRPFSELWITTDASIMKFVTKYREKMRLFGDKMIKCMAAMGGMYASVFDNPEFSPEYQKLTSEKGWVLREIKYLGENLPGNVEIDIVKLEKRKIPESEFQLPAGYKKLDYYKWIKAQMAGE